MTIGKYTLDVKDGIIKITPEARAYYRIAEQVANSMAESGSKEWHEVCLSVINILDGEAQTIKASILSNVSYKIGMSEISSEGVRGVKFEEARAFVDGYNSAARTFNDVFNGVEASVKESLDHILPTN